MENEQSDSSFDFQPSCKLFFKKAPGDRGNSKNAQSPLDYETDTYRFFPHSKGGAK